MTSGWMRATSPSGNAAYEGEVQWSGELGYGVRAPEGGQSGRRNDEATGTKPLREVLEPHLLDEDIPLAHRGMQGRVWRARKGAERNRKKMDAHARPHEGACARSARRRRPTPRPAKADAKAQVAAQPSSRRGRGDLRGERLTHAPRVLLLAATRATVARHPGLRRLGRR